MSSEPSLFAFQPREEVQQGFVRVLAQLASQVRHLTPHSPGTLRESVHATRIVIKRLRALLWFASPSFSSSELNALKAHLRHASHLLAAQRDLVVMKAIVEKLSREAANDADRITLVRVADAQDSRRSITTKPNQSIRKAVAILRATIKQVKESAETKSKWPAATDRLHKSFRAAHRAGEKALRGGKTAQFHDWRKKAKRLLYQLQLTHAVPGKRMTRTIQRVDELQEKLGDYHDSVIAQDRLQNALLDQPRPRIVRQSVKLLEKGRRRLRKDVRNLFRHIASR